MIKKFKKLITNPLFILSLIVVIGVVLRLLQINKTSFWYDEAFTGDVLKLSYKDMLTTIANDKVHPPLYYILVRSWTYIFGVTQIGIRSFSVFCGTLSILVSYILGKTFFDEKNRFPKTGLILALVVAVSPYFVTYSVEARAYSFITLIGLSLIFFMVKWLKAEKSNERLKYLGLSALFALILCFTHYFQIIFLIAIFASVIIYKYVFTQKGVNKKLLLLTIIILLTSLLVAWFLPIRKTLESYDSLRIWWVPRTTVWDFLRVNFTYLFGVVRNVDGVTPAREFILSIPLKLSSSILFGLHIFGYIFVMRSKDISLEKKRLITFLISVTYIFFFGVLLMGFLGINFYVERYLITGGALLLLSFFTTLSLIIKKYWIIIPLSIYIALIFLLKPLPSIPDFRQVAREIDGRYDKVVFQHPADMIITNFYLKDTNTYYIGNSGENYSGWALLHESEKSSMLDLKKGDCFVISGTDIGAYPKTEFTEITNISNDFIILVKN
ncbi:glycosyltransferase family 39 protein [Candidatus Dojkabacteria bacterium]|jgi:uncharacterized membrane protein|nr:glycosyltransferase family 39 protein [Candidatus Dojkabacteria bacterium]